MNFGVCCKPYSQRFGGGGAGGGNGAGVFVAQRVRGWRRTECAGPGQNNSFVLLPLLLSLRRFKCSTATVKVSASDRFSAPFASPSRTPSGKPNRRNLEPFKPETPKITPYLVLAQGRLTLQVVCLGLAHFQLPVRPPKSPSPPTGENPPVSRFRRRGRGRVRGCGCTRPATHEHRRRSTVVSCPGCALLRLPRRRNRVRLWQEACCWAFRSRIPPAASRATCATVWRLRDVI